MLRLYKVEINRVKDAMELYQIGRFLDLDILSQNCEDAIVQRLNHTNIAEVCKSLALSCMYPAVCVGLGVVWAALWLCLGTQAGSPVHTGGLCTHSPVFISGESGQGDSQDCVGFRLCAGQ